MPRTAVRSFFVLYVRVALMKPGERESLLCVWGGRADRAGSVSTHNAPQWIQRPCLRKSCRYAAPHPAARDGPMHACKQRQRDRERNLNAIPASPNGQRACRCVTWPPGRGHVQQRAACGLSIRGEVASPCLAPACVLSLDCMSVTSRAGFAASDSLHEECHRFRRYRLMMIEAARSLLHG
jgi:hypothetical protein